MVACPTCLVASVVASKAVLLAVALVDLMVHTAAALAGVVLLAGAAKVVVAN